MTTPDRSRQTRGPRPAILLAGALAVILTAGCASGEGSYQYHWSYFFNSIFHPDNQILYGLWLTLSISVVSQVIGVVLGVLGALGRMSKFLPFRLLANFYIWFFRGTPLLVQITFFFFGLSVARIYMWPPINLFGFSIEGEIQAGVFALGVNEGAYMSEIVRAGIISIDPGQLEAAKSLGMTYAQAMRRIILPQAARVIVPPLGNEFNNMLKTTSLLVIISVPELYTIFSRKQGQYFAPFEFFLAAAVWYLLLTTLWSIVQAWIERRLAKGTPGSTTRGPSMRERLFGVHEPIEPSMVSGGR
ncbi:MAG: amino acid ABC transporter permease [Candidatus Limnocylindrales bacterium]